jgi:exonuclease SbcD
MPQYPLECYQEVEDVKANIYMLPYVTPLNTRLTFNTDVKTYQEMANFYLERTPLNKDEFNILISHNTVLNNHQALFSDSEYQLSIGGVDEIEASTFKSFDYVALGHLHKAQKVGNNNVYYSGSILKYSESEINYHNGANMIEITKNGINVSTIEFKTLHQMQSICDTFENIMGQAYAASEDYIYITLKNKIVISNAMADIRMKFPNAVSLTYEIYEQDKTTTYKKVNHQEKLSVMDCLKNFYREIFDNDMSEDVVNLAEEIFAKVNENETN